MDATLQYYRDNSSDLLNSTCGENRCADATQRLIENVLGNTTCDVLGIVENGFIEAGYFRGWLDQVTSKGGYLLSLANLALTAQSAYITSNTPVADQADSWVAVQAKYSVPFLSAGYRLQNMTVNCTVQWQKYAETNLPRMMDVVSGKSLKQVMFTTDGLQAQITHFMPYRLWYTVISQGSLTDEQYYFKCYSCYGLPNVKKDSTFEGMNEFVLSMPPTAQVNSTLSNTLTE